MSKNFLIPLLLMSLIPSSFSELSQNYLKYNTKQKKQQLQRKNQIVFDNNINNDWVIIDDDDILILDNDRVLKELNQINKNYEKIKKQYEDIKNEYQDVMNTSTEQLKLVQEKINKQNEIINNSEYKASQYNAKKRLKQRFEQITASVLKSKNLEDINKINNTYNKIIENAITKYKLDKQYVKDIWQSIYTKNKYNINNALKKLTLDIEYNQLNVLNLSNAREFIDNVDNINNENDSMTTQKLNELNKKLHDVISFCLISNSLDFVKKLNNMWNNSIKQAITKGKLSKYHVKNAWKDLYNKNHQILVNKITDICFENKEEGIDLYEQMSELNMFNLDNALEYIDNL